MRNENRTRRPPAGFALAPRVASATVELPADFPESRKEALIDRPLEVFRSERPTRSPGARADHPLNELHVEEAPPRELLLVLQQSLGEEEEHRRPRTDVQ